jgi:NADPH2:quinone reductase
VSRPTSDSVGAASTDEHEDMSDILELRTTLTDDGVVTVSLHETDLPELGDRDVLVQIDAAPINPSDLGLLFAAGDIEAAEPVEVDGRPAVAVPVAPAALAAQRARVGRSMPAGNEGGGTVLAAGAAPEAQELVGKVVGFLSGTAYATRRVVPVDNCVAMPAGTTAEQAAAAFVNPLTALGMLETMRAEGHTAIVHTVGASNLGLMLNRICRVDGVPLVNIVRRPEHVDLLRDEGAEHVVDSSVDSFADDLVAALGATGATIAFDAIGGGELASTLLGAMERVASEGAEFSRYGSDVHKQVYIYGSLDRSPTVLHRTYGLSWSVGGWLLTPFLRQLGPDGGSRLRRRVADEITTTFASRYGMRLSLTDVVDPDRVRRYGRMASGDKALVTPHR